MNFESEVVSLRLSKKGYTRSFASIFDLSLIGFVNDLDALKQHYQSHVEKGQTTTNTTPFSEIQRELSILSMPPINYIEGNQEPSVKLGSV